MRYYQTLLDQILEVEKQGFDPYTETYERRIGQLPVTNGNNVPPTQESPLEAPVNYSQAFTSKGYEDPFGNLSTPEGKLNMSALSTGYNLLQEDPSIGITQEDYLNYTNTNYPQLLQNTYGKENYNLIRSPNGAIGFPNESKPLIPENARFEKSGGAYLLFDEDTGKKVTSYGAEPEYKDAITQNLQNKGLSGMTSENIYDVSRIYRESNSNEELINKLAEAGIEGVSMDEARTFNTKKTKKKDKNK